MDKALFIIDMQEIYVGRGRNVDKYRYDSDRLIDSINKKIAQYANEEVFYFIGIAKGLGGMLGSFPKAGTHEAKLVERLKVINKNIYERSKLDIFSSDEVVDMLRARHIKEVELVGADINTSICTAAVTATNDLKVDVIFNHACMVSNSPDKSVRMREKIKRNRVIFID